MRHLPYCSDVSSVRPVSSLPQRCAGQGPSDHRGASRPSKLQEWCADRVLLADGGDLLENSRISIPTNLETQNKVPRGQGNLQNHHHGGESEAVPTISVRAIPRHAQPRLLTEICCRRDNVESRGNFVAMGKARGNENRRWHGTRRRCNLGDPGITTFCAGARCSLCCVIKSSFDLKFFKASTGWGRFGHGIYISSTSSKFVPTRRDGLPLNMSLTLGI